MNLVDLFLSIFGKEKSETQDAELNNMGTHPYKDMNKIFVNNKIHNCNKKVKQQNK